MPEEKDSPKLPTDVEAIANPGLQDSSIPPSETQTLDMEVHHHPDLQHKRKNFREYFLEFLMIFLAVTMGFFAESLREYFGDREKEKQYMHSLAEDLKKDTSALYHSIRRLKGDINSGHRLIVLVAKNQLLLQNDTTILAVTMDGSHSVDIVFNDRTSSQLKSSGSIRLIRHKKIADSILQYWNNQIVTNQVHERFENMRLEQHKIGFKTFSWYKLFFSAPLMGADSSLVNAILVKPIINAENMNEFLNATSNLFNSAAFQYLPILNKQLELATELIGQIQKEYPVEDDEKNNAN